MLQGYRPEKGKTSSSAQSPLSFEQVCPRWAWKLRQGLDEHDIHTLVRDSKYCIGCWTCIKFGREMGKIAKLHGQSCINDLQPVINHFLEHWNNRHRNITKKCSIDNRQ